MLDWTADAPGAASERQLRAFRVLVLAHWATQAIAWCVRPPPPSFALPPLPLALVAGGLAALCVLALAGRGRLACQLALPLALALVVRGHPRTANHTFLALVLLGLLALLDPDRDDEGALLIQSLRWLAILVFFWAGVQKALSGLYFRGEFLTWMVANGLDRWPQVFGPLIPQPELERLSSLPRFAAGVGPYRADSWLLVLASNAVWIGEIALALGMLLRRTREAAALGAIALVVLIQLAPREWMFALLYVPLLLLFVRGEWNRRLLPAFLLLYGLLLAALLGAPGGDLLLKAGEVL